MPTAFFWFNESWSAAIWTTGGILPGSTPGAVSLTPLRICEALSQRPCPSSLDRQTPKEEFRATLETILPETLDLLKRLQALQSTSELRLVGGTALALQLGHRTSADLDLFGKFDDTRILSEGISHCGKATLENSNASMLFYMIDGVKVDCVNYPYGWIYER